jgi:hypothetical protein
MSNAELSESQVYDVFKQSHELYLKLGENFQTLARSNQITRLRKYIHPAHENQRKN